MQKRRRYEERKKKVMRTTIIETEKEIIKREGIVNNFGNIRA